MFNLIMSSNPIEWASDVGSTGSSSVNISRFLEHTESEIASTLLPLDSGTFVKLANMPTLFMSELQTRYEDGAKYFVIHKGSVSNVRTENGEIYYEYYIHQSFGNVAVSDLRFFQKHFGMNRFEVHRTHWAVKGLDLESVLLTAILPSLHPIIELAPPPPPPPPPNELPSSSNESVVVESVHDFLNQLLLLEPENGEEIFYRGHAQQSYKLEPSLFRKNPDGSYRYSPKEEIMVRELLTAQASEFTNDPYMLDRLVRMQHYGLPTRLLDITSNPLVALFFACSERPKDPAGNELDGEVIIMRTPTKDVHFFDSDTVSCIANLCLMNEAELNEIDTNLDVGSFNTTRVGTKLLNFIKREKPYFLPVLQPNDLSKILFVRGRNTHERMQAQSGAFLLFGKDAILEETGHSSLNVKRIVIRNKNNIISELERLNIKTSTIYPGIEKVTAEIAKKHQWLS